MTHTSMEEPQQEFVELRERRSKTNKQTNKARQSVRACMRDHERVWRVVQGSIQPMSH